MSGRDDDRRGKPPVAAEKRGDDDRATRLRQAFGRDASVPTDLVAASASVPVKPAEQASVESKPGQDEERPFVRRAWFDTDELEGARWWNESFQSFTARPGRTRREFLQENLGWLAIGAAAVLWVGSRVSRDDDENDGDQPPPNEDALELQRRAGWDVGYAGRALSFPGASEVDVLDSFDWRARLGDLPRLLTPSDAGLVPYAVPTLFQSLTDASSSGLRTVIKPVHAPEMDAAFARGRALAELATEPDAPRGVAVVLDLPGPTAVAAAAGLAASFAPVFTFDNWPHPLGVVPSHLTLGASLYYLPLFEAASRTRPMGAPPVFVLDSHRLDPYRDDASLFDNRYLARLPGGGRLASLGIRRILYVRPGADSLTELDDLNDDFVELERGGIEVRALALTDFSQADLLAPGRGPAPASDGQSVHQYYYGGHPYHHHHFWSTYHWTSSPEPRRVTARAPAPPPPRLSDASSYRPAPRPTLFSSHSVGGLSGVGKQKPSGFGRVSMRNGSFGSYRSSSSSFRSGSFGRSRSSFSG